MSCVLIAGPAKADERLKIRLGSHDHFVRLVIESKSRLTVRSSLDASKRTVTVSLVGPDVINLPTSLGRAEGVSGIRLNRKGRTSARAIISFDHAVALHGPVSFPPEHGFSNRLLLDFPAADAPAVPPAPSAAAYAPPPPLPQQPPTNAPQPGEGVSLPSPPSAPDPGIFSSRLGFLARDTRQSEVEAMIRQELGAQQGFLRMKLAAAGGPPQSILVLPLQDDWLGPLRVIFRLSNDDGRLLSTYLEWSAGPQSGRTTEEVLRYLETEAAAAGFRRDSARGLPSNLDDFYVADRLKDPKGRSVTLAFVPESLDNPHPALVRALLAPAPTDGP